MPWPRALSQAPSGSMRCWCTLERGAHFQLSPSPTPTSFTIQTLELRKNDGEKWLAHQVAKDGISWHLLPSSKNSTFSVLCFMRLSCGQGKDGHRAWKAVWVETSSHPSNPQHLSSTPRIVFSSILVHHLISPESLGKSKMHLSKCIQTHPALS